MLHWFSLFMLIYSLNLNDLKKTKEHWYLFDSTAYETHWNAFPFSFLSSFHLALVEFGRHPRMFGLAVNNATTHAKKRKPDICHFIITSNLLLSCEEKGQSLRAAAPVSSLSSFLLIIHHVEMNWNVVLIPGLMTYYSTSSAVSLSAGWITAMLDNVSAVSVWNDRAPKEK